MALRGAKPAASSSAEKPDAAAEKDTVPPARGVGTVLAQDSGAWMRAPGNRPPWLGSREHREHSKVLASLSSKFLAPSIGAAERDTVRARGFGARFRHEFAQQVDLIQRDGYL